MLGFYETVRDLRRTERKGSERCVCDGEFLDTRTLWNAFRRAISLQPGRMEIGKYSNRTFRSRRQVKCENNLLLIYINLYPIRMYQTCNYLTKFYFHSLLKIIINNSNHKRYKLNFY